MTNKAQYTTNHTNVNDKRNKSTNQIKSKILLFQQKTMKELQRIIYNTNFSRKTIHQSVGKSS